MVTCATCKHFIGAGDWNLCCDLKYDLCYEHTLACSKYEVEVARRQADRRVCCKDCKHYEIEWKYCLRFGCHTLEDDTCGEFKRKKNLDESNT